jgi:hypothetical protein
VDVKAVFMGTARATDLKRRPTRQRTSDAEAAGERGEAGVERRGEEEAAAGAAGRGVVSAGGQRGEGGGLERLLEEVRREFSGPPTWALRTATST